MIGRRFHSTTRVVVLALAGCLAGCGGGHATSSPTVGPSHSRPRPVAMPTVLGYPLQQAKQAIRATGLDGPTKVKATPYDNTAQNQVIATNPLGGKAVLSDSPVTIYVASGPIACLVCSGRGRVAKMPAVCGLNLQQARLLLVEKGITLERAIPRPSSKAPGVIIGSVPAVGTFFIAYGSRSAKGVVVMISSGQAAPPTAAGQGSC
jgi:beta-lactam-binding protein with PASTA domain